MSESTSTLEPVDSFIKQTILDHTIDIRENRDKIGSLTTTVQDIKTAQQLTNQTVDNFNLSMADVKANINKLEGHFGTGMRELQKKLDANNEKSNEKMDKIIDSANDNQIEQLKEFKSFVIKIVTGVAIAGAVGGLSIFFTI